MNVDVDDLIERLREQFTDVNKQMHVRSRLFTLRQQTSVQQYTTLFRHLQCELEVPVDDETAQHLYLYGLKEAVKM